MTAYDYTREEEQGGGSGCSIAGAMKLLFFIAIIAIVAYSVLAFGPNLQPTPGGTHAVQRHGGVAIVIATACSDPGNVLKELYRSNKDGSQHRAKLCLYYDSSGRSRIGAFIEQLFCNGQCDDVTAFPIDPKNSRSIEEYLARAVKQLRGFE